MYAFFRSSVANYECSCLKHLSLTFKTRYHWLLTGVSPYSFILLFLYIFRFLSFYIFFCLLLLVANRPLFEKWKCISLSLRALINCCQLTLLNLLYFKIKTLKMYIYQSLLCYFCFFLSIKDLNNKNIFIYPLFIRYFTKL